MASVSVRLIRRGRTQILSYAMISVVDISSKLVFVWDRRKKDWVVLISINPELFNEEIVRLYGRRWDAAYPDRQPGFGHLLYSVYEEMADITFLESLQRILTMAIDKLRKAGELSEKIYSKLIDVVMDQAVKLLGLESNQCQITTVTS